MWCEGYTEVSEGPCAKPKELHVANGVFMKPGTINKSATEEEIETAETKMDTYEQHKAMCKHILIVLPWLGLAIFNKLRITQDSLLQMLRSKIQPISFLDHGST